MHVGDAGSAGITDGLVRHLLHTNRERSTPFDDVVYGYLTKLFPRSSTRRRGRHCADGGHTVRAAAVRGRTLHPVPGVEFVHCWWARHRSSGAPGAPRRRSSHGTPCSTYITVPSRTIGTAERLANLLATART